MTGQHMNMTRSAHAYADQPTHDALTLVWYSAVKSLEKSARFGSESTTKFLPCAEICKETPCLQQGARRGSDRSAQGRHTHW